VVHRGGRVQLTLPRGAALFALCAALAAACSSASAVGVSGGTGPSGAVMAPTGPNAAEPPSFCPPSPPNERDPCVFSTSACEYGNSAIPGCNVRFNCEQEQWQPVQSWQLECGERCCGAPCPESFDGLEPGGACATPGTLCTYYEGTCGCLDGDAGDADAGGADAGAPTWTCVRPERGCPAKRPAIGSECVRPMDCDYGSCAFGTNLAVTCSGSVWIESTPPCP
jgi:hypothetical protein